MHPASIAGAGRGPRAFVLAMAMAAASLAALAGCGGTRPARGAAATSSGPERARPPERFDPAPIIEVRKVLLGGAHAGYVKTKLDERLAEPLIYYLVYDLGFEQRGFLTQSHTTYRLERDTFTDLGTRTMDDAMRLLLGDADPAVEVAYAPMDPPRRIADEVAAPAGRR